MMHRDGLAVGKVLLLLVLIAAGVAGICSEEDPECAPSDACVNIACPVQRSCQQTPGNTTESSCQCDTGLVEHGEHCIGLPVLRLGPSNKPPSLAFGEVRTVELQLFLPKGLWQTVSVTIQVPAYISFNTTTPVVLAAVGSDVVGLAEVDDTAVNTSLQPNTTIISFSFSDFNNTASNQSTEADMVLLTMPVHVPDHPALYNGDTLLLKAVVDLGLDISVETALLITVREPQLLVMAAVLNPVPTLQAGDEITMQLRLHHGAQSTSAAFELSLFLSKMLFVDTLVRVEAGLLNNASWTENVTDWIIDLRAVLPLASEVNVTVVIRLNSNLRPGQMIDLPAVVAMYTSSMEPAPQFRQYLTSGPAQSEIAVVPHVVWTSLNASTMPVVAGGHVLLALQVTLPRATVNVTLELTVNPQLTDVGLNVEYIQEDLVFAISPSKLSHHTLADGQQLVVFDIGPVTRHAMAITDTFTLLLWVSIPDGNALAGASTVIMQTKLLADDAPLVAGSMITTTLAIQVPDLEVANRWTMTALLPSAGDSIELSVVVAHTADSQASAFDILIPLAVSPDLVLDNTSIACLAGCQVSELRLAHEDTARLCIVVHELPLATTLHLRLQAIVAQTVLALTPLSYRLDDVVYTGTINATSAATYIAHRRLGLVPSASVFELELQSPWTAQLEVNGFATTRNVFFAGLFLAGTDASAGITEHEVALHQLLQLVVNITIPKGKLPLAVDFFLPVSEDGLLLVEPGAVVAAIVTQPATLLPLPVVTVATSSSMASGEEDLVHLTFDSALLNQVEGFDSEVLDVLTLQLSVRVRDAMVGQTLNFTANVHYQDYLGTQIVSLPSPVFTVVVPLLELDSTSFEAVVDAYDEVLFSISIKHAMGSTAAAYDIVSTNTHSQHFEIQLDSFICTPACDSVDITVALEGQQLNLTLAYLPLGHEFTASWTALVRQSVPPQSNLPYRDVLTYDTHPADTGAYTGIVRPEQSILRHVTTKQPVLQQTFVSALFGNTSGTPEIELVPGETATFRFVIQMPEVTTDLVLHFHMNTAYFRPWGEAVVEHVGSNLEASTLLQAGDKVVMDVTGMMWILHFGNSVVNLHDVDQFFTALDTIEVVGAVRLMPGLATGFALRNKLGSVAGYLGYSGHNLSTSMRIRVREPQIGFSDPLAVHYQEAGDNILYMIVLQHSDATSAVAYDLTFKYTLHPKLILDDTTIARCLHPGPSMLWGAINETACRAQGGLVPSMVIGDSQLHFAAPEIPKGWLLQATFTAILVQEVVPQDILENTYNLVYKSMPNSLAKTYAFAGEVLTSVKPPTISSSVVVTSDVFTFDGDLTIHEELIMQFTIRLPEGVIPSTVVKIHIPAGLRLLNTSIVYIGQNLYNSTLTTGQAPDGINFRITPSVNNQTESIWLYFGDILNKFDNRDDANDTLVLEVAVRLEDAPANFGGQHHYIPCTIFWQNFTRAASGSHLVPVVEPLLSTSIDDNVAPNIPDANDRLHFVARVQHTSQAIENRAPAYQMLAQLTFPVELVVHMETIAVTVSNSNETAVITVEDAQSFSVYLRVLSTHEETVTIEVAATLVQSVRPDLGFPSSIHVGWASVGSSYYLPGRVRADNSIYPLASASHWTIVKRATTQLALHATSIPETVDPLVNVGELVNYRSIITVPEADMNLTAIITLPSGMELFNATVLWVGLSIQGAQLRTGDSVSSASGLQAVFNFGAVRNVADNVVNSNDTLAIELWALVLDAVTNQGGTNLATAVAWQVDAVVHSNTHSVYVVEPLLASNAIVVSPASGAVDGGDDIIYTVNLHHLPTSTSAGFSIVFKVQVHSELEIISATTGSVPSTFTILPGAQLLEWYIDVLTLEVAVFTGSLVARVRNSMMTQTAGVHANATAVIESSRGGFGRRIEIASASPDTVIDKPATSLQLLSSSDPNTQGLNAAVHELFTFLGTVTLPELTMELSLEVRTTISTRMHFLDAVVQVGTNINCTAVPSYSAQSLNASVHDRVRFFFGGCRNAFDNKRLAEADTINITLLAVLQDVPSNSDGVSTFVRITARYSDGVTGNLASVNSQLRLLVREPLLTMNGIPPPDASHVIAGELLDYAVHVAHTSTSQAAAYDAGLQLTLAAGLTYTALQFDMGSAVPSGAIQVLPNSDGTTLLRFMINELLPGSLLAFIVTSTVQNMPMNTALPITVDLRFDSSADDQHYPGREYFLDTTFTPYMAHLSLAWYILGSSIPQTEQHLLAIGETITFALVITARDKLPMTVRLTDVSFLVLKHAFIARVGAEISGPPLFPAELSPLIDGDDLVFDLGIVSNSNNAESLGLVDELELQFMLAVRQESSTTEGSVGSIVTVVSFGPLSDQVIQPVIVVGPKLVQTCDLAVSSGGAGDLLPMTCTVQHAADSTSPAFNLNLLLNISPHLEYLAAQSVRTMSSPTLGPVVVSNPGLNQMITELLVGDVLHLTITLKVLNTAYPETDYSPRLYVSYYSTPTEPERYYAPAPIDIPFRTLLPNFGLHLLPGFDFARENPSAVSIGEEFTLVLQVNLTKGTSPNLRVTAATTLLGGSQVVLPITRIRVLHGGLIFSGVPTLLVGSSDNNSATAPNRRGLSTTAMDNTFIEEELINEVQLFLGDVVNSYDNTQGSADQLEIEVSMVVLANQMISAGATLDVEAELYSPALSKSLTVERTLTVIEALMDIAAHVDAFQLNGQLGVIFSYTIAHLSTSGAPSFALSMHTDLSGALGWGDLDQNGNLTLERLETTDQHQVHTKIMLESDLTDGDALCSTLYLNYTGPDSNHRGRRYHLQKTACYQVTLPALALLSGGVLYGLIGAILFIAIFLTIVGLLAIRPRGTKDLQHQNSTLDVTVEANLPEGSEYCAPISAAYPYGSVATDTHHPHGYEDVDHPNPAGYVTAEGRLRQNLGPHEYSDMVANGENPYQDAAFASRLAREHVQDSQNDMYDLARSPYPAENVYDVGDMGDTQDMGDHDASGHSVIYDIGNDPGDDRRNSIIYDLGDADQAGSGTRDSVVYDIADMDDADDDPRCAVPYPLATNVVRGGADSDCSPVYDVGDMKDDQEKEAVIYDIATEDDRASMSDSDRGGLCERMYDMATEDDLASMSGSDHRGSVVYDELQLDEPLYSTVVKDAKATPKLEPLDPSRVTKLKKERKSKNKVKKDKTARRRPTVEEADELYSHMVSARGEAEVNEQMQDMEEATYAMASMVGSAAASELDQQLLAVVQPRRYTAVEATQEYFRDDELYDLQIRLKLERRRQDQDPSTSAATPVASVAANAVDN